MRTRVHVYSFGSLSQRPRPGLPSISSANPALRQAAPKVRRTRRRLGLLRSEADLDGRQCNPYYTRRVSTGRVADRCMLRGIHQLPAETLRTLKSDANKESKASSDKSVSVIINIALPIQPLYFQFRFLPSPHYLSSSYFMP